MSECLLKEYLVFFFPYLLSLPFPFPIGDIDEDELNDELSALAATLASEAGSNTSADGALLLMANGIFTKGKVDEKYVKEMQMKFKVRKRMGMHGLMMRSCHCNILLLVCF